MGIEELKNQVLTQVTNVNDREIHFITTSGEEFCLAHLQDCCESVYVEDICGDLSDLLGYPLLVASELTHKNINPEGVQAPPYQDDSFTWTFYKLGTIKGSVPIRWYGGSNGYYSEGVEFSRVEK